MTFTYAGRYLEAALRTDGTLLKGGSVAVYLPGTSTLASLYTDATKGVSAANPVTTDSTTGMLEFWADPGTYRLAGPGITLADAPVVPSAQEYAEAGSRGAPSGVASLDASTRVVEPASDLSTFGVYSVLGKGSSVVGDGATDDAAALTAFIASTPVGATVLFPARVYGVRSPVRYLPGRSYIGEGWCFSSGNGAVIKQLNGANMTETAGVSGLFVANAWYTNAGSCDGPAVIRNLMFEGNFTHNASSSACGVVVMNFWGRVEDCYFHDLPLDGIRLTDTGRDGTTVIGNSASENRILRCKIDTAHGNGITQVCANSISNQDGFCEGNLLNTITGNGIIYQRGSGWSFRRNHMYGVGGHGLYLDNCYATVVDHNEIEDFGGAAASSTYYNGIWISQLSGRGTSITGNYIGCAEPGSTSHFQYLHAVSAFGQTDAHITAVGNTVRGPDSPTGNGIGIVLENGASGAVLKATYGLNNVGNVNTLYYTPATTPTPAAGANAGTSPPTPTVTSPSDNRRGSIQFGTGSSPGAGAQVAVTYSAPIASSAQPVICPVNAATVAKQPYVSGATTSGFTVNFATAPAASQGGSTYEVSYAVVD